MVRPPATVTITSAALASPASRPSPRSARPMVPSASGPVIAGGRASPARAPPPPAAPPSAKDSRDGPTALPRQDLAQCRQRHHDDRKGEAMDEAQHRQTDGTAIEPPCRRQSSRVRGRPDVSVIVRNVHRLDHDLLTRLETLAAAPTSRADTATSADGGRDRKAPSDQRDEPYDPTKSYTRHRRNNIVSHRYRRWVF